MVLNIDGIQVIYLNESYDQTMSINMRLKAFLRFAFKSTLEARKHKNVDLIIATSTPLTIGIPVLFLKLTKSLPYLFEVRDLWPEVPIQMGAINNGFVKWLIRKFESAIYYHAEHVIALSPGIQEGIIKYIPKGKTTVIPNMAKNEEFWPREKNLELEETLGLSTKSFKIIHFGALGRANGVESIIESAKLIKNDNTVEFIFVGGGSSEESLKEDCLRNSLSNVKFLGSYPMRETSEIVNLADVSIVSFKDLPILYTNSPNKLFDSLSAGKPIIVNSAGWTKKLVEEFDCGLYINPRDPQGLVEIIKYLQSNRSRVLSLGRNSRKLAEDYFDKTILTKEFLKVISNFKN